LGSKLGGRDAGVDGRGAVGRGRSDGRGGDAVHHGAKKQQKMHPHMLPNHLSDFFRAEREIAKL